MGAETSHHVRPLRTRRKSSVLLQRVRGAFKRPHDRSLDDSIVEMRGIIGLLPRGHPALVARLTTLGILLVTRFDQGDRIQDLEEAVSVWRSAALLVNIAAMNPSLPAINFLWRFYYVLESGLLSPAIRHSGTSAEDRVTARELLPKCHDFAHRSDDDLCTLRDIETVLSSVNSYLVSRLNHAYRAQRGSGVDSVALCRCRVMFTAAGYESFSMLDLGVALSRRFRVSRHLVDLEEAISVVYHALENPGLVPKEELARRTRSQFMLSDGFRHLRDLETPHRLLQILRRIAEFICEEEKATALYLLGGGHEFFFRTHGFDYAELDEALTAYRASVRMRPTHETLHDLAAALVEMYDRFHDIPDINEAIDAFQQAIELAAEDPTCGPHTQSIMHRDLGSAYILMFLRLCDDSKLQAAVKELRRAVAIDTTNQSSWVQLAVAYRHSFSIDCSQRGALDESITIIEGALKLLRSQRDTSIAVDARPKVYVFLAQSLVARFDHSGDLEDQKRATRAYKDALEGMNDGNKHRLAALNGYIAVLWRWELRSWNSGPATMSTFQSTFQKLALLTSEAVAIAGSAQEMYKAAEMHSVLVFLSHLAEPAPVGSHSYTTAHEEEMAAFQRSVDLIPQVAWIGSSVSLRYELMAQLRSFLSTPVLGAVLRNDHRGLIWFEQGRALVWNQIRSLRTRAEDFRPLESLTLYIDISGTGEDSEPLRAGLRRSRAREIPTEHVVFSDTLHELSTGLGELALGVDTTTLRHLAREREKVLSSIRSQAGFQNFLKPKGVAELLPSCERGPIICINMHDIACHALILRTLPSPDSGTSELTVCNIRILMLPDLTPSRAQEWRTRLNSSLNLQPVRKSRPATVAGSRKDLQKVLREIWLTVVQPILNELEIRTDQSPLDGDTLPHVTWCTTGALAFLPLHAAGMYESGSPSACDIIVSSYTPNMASLLPSSAQVENLSQPSILVVAQPNADGVSALPGTIEEARAIGAHFPDTSTFLNGPAGTVDAVLAMMATHEYVHLACHGEQDPVDPLKSSFVLADGRLTLERLMSSSSSIGQLAFLSACETATGDETIPEEVVHLAAGMLAVGYRSVVATMWSIGDNHAPLVADAFYKKLQQQCDADGKRNVARALHHAVAELRNRVGDEQFAQWVPFVHWGV